MEFLKQNARFSFLYGGEDALSLPHHTEIIQEGNTLTSVYLFPDGLKVTNVAKKKRGIRLL